MRPPWQNFNRELSRVAQQHLSRATQAGSFDILSHFPTGTLTNGLRVALATGNWNLIRFNMERSGITQVLSRLSYLATLGMMGRIRSQFEKSRKISGVCRLFWPCVAPPLPHCSLCHRPPRPPDLPMGGGVPH